MIHSRLSLHIFWTRHLDHLQKLNPINKNHVIMYSVGDNMTTKNIYLNVSVSSTISFNVRFTVCQLLLNSCRNETNVEYQTHLTPINKKIVHPTKQPRITKPVSSTILLFPSCSIRSHAQTHNCGVVPFWKLRHEDKISFKKAEN